jgi:hypothetical protein
VADADLEKARKQLDEVLERFRRVAHKAIDAAANPKASETAISEARHEATFGLAAVGMALKAALRAARPGDPAV